METKQVIVIRRDLSMRRGKEIAQGAHASMAWLRERMTKFENLVMFEPALGKVCEVRLNPAELNWYATGYRKVVCQVPGLDELMDLHRDASQAGLESHLITDAGHTEFHGEPTVTALAVGPDYDYKIDAITGGLELY